MSITKSVLTLCLVTKQDICAQTSACFTNIAMTSFENYQVSTQYCIGQSDLPKARSIQASQWYDKASFGDVFMFIDSDQTFTKADIETSLHYLKQADVVCGAYCRRDGTMTLQPKDPVAFYQNKEGEIWFGATGFMMISYNILHRIASESKKVIVSRNNDSTSHTFFLERVVTEPDLGIENMWLGEDFSFCWLARQHGAKVIGYISPTIGHILSGERFVSIPKYETWEKNSIVIYCGNTPEPWSPNKLKSGLGGSELAIIYLTKYWALKGYSVTVYCNCDKPGLYEGVKYNDITTFNPLDHFYILIGWRALHLFNFVDIQAKKCVADLHDIIKPSQLTPQIIKRTDVFFVKSKYHASMLKDVPKEKIVVLSNGGYVPYTETEKDKNYLIYSSSYDRGIAYILKWAWPKIKQACPDAYLKIFYGWDGFDATLPKTNDIKLYKDTIVELMKQDGVMECGRISQQELLKEKAKANIHLYTGDFQEIDCISIRESAGLKVIPVVSKYQHVFEEKMYCQCIEGNPLTQEMQERVAEVVIRLINDEKYCEEIRNSMQLPVSETWENIADLWLEKLFQKEEEDKNKIVEPKEIKNETVSVESKIQSKSQISQDFSNKKTIVKRRGLTIKCIYTYNKDNLVLEEWFKNDKLHRDDDLPACIEYYESDFDEKPIKSKEVWYQNGEIKRDACYYENKLFMVPECYIRDTDINNPEHKQIDLRLPSWIEYHENGKTKEERWYVNNKIERYGCNINSKPALIQYYDNGNIKRAEYHQNDNIDYYIEYYENGKTKRECVGRGPNIDYHEVDEFEIADWKKNPNQSDEKELVFKYGLTKTQNEPLYRIETDSNFEANETKQDYMKYVVCANNSNKIVDKVNQDLRVETKQINLKTKCVCTYKKNKLILEEWFANDKLHRDNDLPASIAYYETKEEKEKLSKLKEIWYQNGEIKRNYEYSMKPEASPCWIEYYENGNVKEKRWYKNGLLGKEEKFWDDKPDLIQYYENGNEKRVEYHENGILCRDCAPSVIEYYENGQKKMEENHYRNKEGSTEHKHMVTEFYSKNNYEFNDKKKSQRWFVDGKVTNNEEDVPASVEYYENGNVKNEAWYKEGKLHRNGNHPAFIEYFPSSSLKNKGNRKQERWYKEGELHNDEDFESVIEYGDLGCLRSVWYRNGKKHRGNDDPAEIIYNNIGDKLEERWFIDGLLYRENGKPVTVYYSELNNKIKQDPIEEIDENELQIVSTEILDYNRSNDIENDFMSEERLIALKQIEQKVKNGDYTEETKYSSNNVRCVKTFKKFNLIVEEWFSMERRHRNRNKKLGETLPAFIEYYESTDEKSPNLILKKQEWYKNGYLHRENGPAIVEYYDNFFPSLKSRECWYKYGTLEKNEKGELMITKYYEDGRIVT